MLVSDYLFEVLNGKADSSALIKWILGDLNEDPLPEIQRNDFALFFLNYLQEQTSSVSESCPSNRRDDSSCTQTDGSKKSISADRDSCSQENAKQMQGHARKIFPSPRNESAAHSLKRVTPQPQPQSCESFPYNPHQRNGLPLFASFPGNHQYNNSACLTSTIPMIFDHRLGYSVPYYGNRNHSGYYHLQQNLPTPNQNFFNNNTNGNNYLHDKNVSPNFAPVLQQFHNSSALNSSRCSSPGVNVPTNCNISSPTKYNKVYQTPKTPKSNKVEPKTPKSNKVEPKTPNSNSSSSSGVSLMSPESPLYSENFPAMGSNERRCRRESLNSYSDSISNQSRKHSYNKKRIKPVQLNKSPGNNDLEGKFDVINDSCDKAATKFPERKQNVFEEKGFSNRNVVNNLEKSNITKSELEKSVEEEKTGDNTCLQVKCNDETGHEIKNDCDLSSDIKKIEDAEEEKKVLNLVNNESKSSVDKKPTKSKTSVIPDPLKVNFQIYLNKLAEIYSTLLDANLIPNVTAEMYFIFSLLTVDGSKKKLKNKVKKSDSNESCEGPEDLCDKTQAMSLQSQNEAKVVEASIELQLFHNVHQYIYFSCAVLSRQKHLLAILDKTTLKLLIENKRLSIFVPEIIEFLKSLYEKKDKEFKCKQETGLEIESTFINPVPFQMELDNRDTFSSQTSFQVFRKQRDAFYEILQVWNEKHDKRDWHFHFLSSKIEKLFLMSTDPVNMRHLARHFCDLLLKTVSAKDNKAEEYSVSGLPEIDKSKLNRLTERLIRPSVSGQKDPRPSPDFPGLQAFYHDFLVIPAANYSFHTHVINCLAEQIDYLNGTSFQFEEPDGQMVQEETRLAFLKCLQSLCVLAKFLGLVVFSPFRSSNELPQSVLQDEISFRNKIHPPLDLHNYLSNAEEEGRLVQTVPWIIEYLGMMDTVAPFLTSYQAVLNTLFSLYLCTAPHLFSSLPYIHPSNEKLLTNESDRLSDESNAEISDHKSDISLLKRSKLSYQSAVLLRLTVGWLFDTSNFSQSLFFKMASSYKGYQQKQITEEKWCNTTVDNSDIVDEKLLCEFCPYLINLRVRLAESTDCNKKGPVRHITPVPSQQPASSKLLAATTLELQLEENFFMGHSESLKRTVDFAAERAASACIKHICSNIIVCLKNSVLKATSSNKVLDLQPYIDKYNKGVEEEIENVISQRLNVALSVLLGPDVIEQPLNNICQQIAARKLRERVVNWLQSHINLVDVLTKSQVDGNGQNDNSSQNQSDRVPNDCMTFSEALILMQDNLNDILDSRGNEGIRDSSETITLFKNLSATISFYHDSSLCIQLLLSLVLDYLLLSVTYQPKMVTNDVLDEFCMLWKLRNYSGPLERLLSPRNMMILVQGGPANSSLTWEKFGRIIVFALTHDIMTITSLELQAVAFFRYNWPNDLLLAMSKCLSGILEDVRKLRSCIDDPKFVLMLELCSDMAAEMNTGFDELDS